MADVEQERLTALWREAAAAVDEVDARKLRAALVAAVNGNWVGADQAWALIREWDKNEAECGRLREQLDARRATENAARAALAALPPLD
jgi:hypothetical protein